MVQFQYSRICEQQRRLNEGHGTLVSDKKADANIFNIYFTAVFEKLDWPGNPPNDDIS